MSVAFKQVVKNIGRLTSREKAQIAHYPITSLEVSMMMLLTMHGQN
jgi:hypothetical protein